MAQKEQRLARRKVIIVGDSACGKTSLVSVFTLGRFPAHHSPTVCNNSAIQCRINGKIMELAIWDTASHGNTERLRTLAYSRVHVVILAFSVSSLETLQNVITKWQPELLRYCPDAPTILVGLKKDLRDNPYAQMNLRMRNENFLAFSDGEEVRDQIAAKMYLECSSLTGEGVDYLFELVTRQSLSVHHRERGGGCCVVS